MIGEDPQMVRTLHAARLVAGADAPVLINGGKGVGKSLLARVIHVNSTRREHGFTLINCVGVDDHQFPLNSFSGSDRTISELTSGTLVLKEIGELSSASQAGLVRFIDSTAAEGLRVMATSSMDLQLLVEKGEFRQDLYFKINVIPLSLPDLNSRESDIPLLITHFTKCFSLQHKRRTPLYSAATFKILKKYQWRGNVQELRNFCERMVLLLPGKRIGAENLPAEMRVKKEGATNGAVIKLPDGGIDLSQLEQNLIRQALHNSRGNRSRAARLLGITRDKLNYRIKKYALIGS
ncbi:MAG: sigma 54-interacting transcriptional regulator [Pseudomonadota bacterium]|nr:sigma 54-interacting transcriptional regulator [Pseudomonadota bacterium]